MLTLRTEGDGNNLTLFFEGELDMSTTDRLADTLRRLSAEGASITLDFTALRFIDSTGMGHLIYESKRLLEQGCLLTFCNMSDDIRMVFEVLGVADILEEAVFAH